MATPIPRYEPVPSSSRPGSVDGKFPPIPIPNPHLGPSSGPPTPRFPLPPSHGSRTQSYASTTSSVSGPYAYPTMLRSGPPRMYRQVSMAPTLSDKFQFDADPAVWGISTGAAEADDALHDPKVDYRSHNVFTARGMSNVGCILILALACTGLFVGYPLARYFTNPREHAQDVPLMVNSTGQVASIGNFGLIDLHTPKEFYKVHSYNDPSQVLQLVFSDEFEEEGRSFYPGDDPYWEALDLHYWATGNMEWYDPAAVTTRDGAMEINLSVVKDPTSNHGLDYMGGMVSTWNKFCFTGGLILADVMMPGTTNVFGLWPALWTMGNLGRAGYGATLDGLWPYSYDSCDNGALPNQTTPDGKGPPAALDDGHGTGTPLSYQPGQRLSRCTCPGESHPGPMHRDGSYVGRSAPEIDIFEGQIGGPPSARTGDVSQSAQFAPFNALYAWFNTSDNMVITDPRLSHQNDYSGGVYQQPCSVVTATNQQCFQLKSQCYAAQGFEYVPGYDNAYITWISDNKVAWTLNSGGLAADPRVGIAARPIPEEPLYILANLGISHSFGFVDIEHLVFPATMRIDWVRVYQHPDRINIGCDPPNRPTSAYINTYLEAYTNPNLTTWKDDYKQPIPKNKLLGQC
ncbi:GH16 domain-containing protein [Mycena indigotica]|uniref:GH16 domain-containing protein n=1 Tax=Mycena indigotica TaxID=2126181 RepID=A0A8H6S0S7_9AGAR|nr:GH16 domain-containing protein [Mycena indigotica]KAF7291215.1 GH16 domain-containing protein [Mycena indigotica]